MPKPPLILLVNPWITDFAAHDLWAKPMGLLILASLLRNGGCGVALVDCLDRRDPFTNSHPDVLPGVDKKFGTGRYPRMRLPKPAAYEAIPRWFYRHGIHPDSFRRRISQIGTPDLIWVTSTMTYWYPGVEQTTQILREAFPETPLWLGGIYATLCPEHAGRCAGVDRIITDNLSVLPRMIHDETGFTVGNPGEWSGFSFWPGPALDLTPAVEYAPVLTGIGCVYRCPYCASSILQPTRSRAPAERIFGWISIAYAKFGVTDFAFYDDALLLDAEDTLRPALEMVVRQGLPLRFHAPNALHVRALTGSWCDLLYASGFRTIRLGLETTQDEKSRDWGGKVDTGLYLKAIENLFKAGFSGDQIGVYLLSGLPGQLPEEVAEAVRFVVRSGVRPHIAEYSPIPGTRMWAEALSISPFDIEAEPLYHNNTFFACRRPDFTYEDMGVLKKMARVSVTGPMN